MKRFTKSSITVSATFALGIMMALPAAAQPVQTETARQASYSVEVVQAPGTGNASTKMPMTFTVEQKPGTGDVVITWIEDSREKAKMEKRNAESVTTEYEIESSRRKGAGVEQPVRDVRD